ncbi:MAG: HAMP domain-containing histidine kinase, partial [Patescibacteria group bacterium]|nr:HAMP domain-containing histidine kinase [Patescibacteria group bacterium]
MNMFWKRFAAWATGSKSDPFKRARLRLTLYYIAIMAVILIAFSLFLYFSLAKNINDNLENDALASDSQVAANAIDQIQTTILTVDAVILVLTAGLSYALAGRTLRPIRLALEAQAQFTADASHEFRTPLAIIKYGGDVALKDPRLTLAEAKAAIQSGVEEAEHMSALVERLLLLARGDSGPDNLRLAPIDFKNLVEKAAGNMRALIQNKRLVLNITTLEPASVAGDAGTLNEMVFNILQNSIDYTPEGGSISLDLKQKDGLAQLTVTDTGIGIAAKDLPHVFERFYKSDQARS